MSAPNNGAPDVINISVLDTIVALHHDYDQTFDFLGLDAHWLTVVLIHILVGAAEQHTCISIEDITQKTAYKAPTTIRRYLAAFTEKGLAKLNHPLIFLQSFQCG